MPDLAADRTNNTDGVAINYLEEALRLQVLKEMELEAHGYPPRLVEVAIKRAWGVARKRAEDVSPTIRSQAFYDIFKVELNTWTEPWIVRTLKSLEETDPGSDVDEEGGE